jgi:hypothetical protein
MLAYIASCRYHVDSLLTMYDLYRNLGENQYAEVIERLALGLARTVYTHRI